MTPFALVVMKMLAIAAPLGALVWIWRIYPRSPLVWLALIPATCTLPLLVVPGYLPIVVIVDALLASIAVTDLLTVPAKKNFAVERHSGRIVSLGKPHKVELTVLNHSAKPYDVAIRDGVPVPLNPEPTEFDRRFEGRSRWTTEYVLRAKQRGSFVIDRVHLQIRSRWRLWQRQIEIPCETLLHVYPDMKQLSQYALLARTDRLNLLGVRRTRRIGQDHDFERLRDFTVDDNYKHIDWRATARRRKMTVREFQSSQSQRIIFLIDTGRMMTNLAEGLSLLDHGFNAMLMLSYVALRQGDAVGMISFSDEIHNFIPPKAGMNQMNRLLHASFDRFPTLVESRYDLAFRYLAGHCRRRSLVVLVTNLIDEVNANQIHRYLANLVGRHLPLGVLLRDRQLFDAIEPERFTDERLWPAAAAAEILTWRHQVITDLESKGVLSLDVYPEHMTAPLVNRYLEVKARHLL